MNTLHVHSVPDDMYRRLQQLSQSHNRSLSAQVVVMLTQALEEERQWNQAKALTAIQRRRFTPPVRSTSSLELLREDRQR
jgi:plasmid stability protein